MHRGTLHEPDITINEVWDDHWRRTAALSREKQLMLAVLKSALLSYQKYAFAESADDIESFRDAADWVDSNDDQWFFSFRRICENLDISPDQIRRSLARWKHRVEAGEVVPHLEATPLHPAEAPLPAPEVLRCRG